MVDSKPIKVCTDNPCRCFVVSKPKRFSPDGIAVAMAECFTCREITTQRVEDTDEDGVNLVCTFCDCVRKAHLGDFARIVNSLKVTRPI